MTIPSSLVDKFYSTTKRGELQALPIRARSKKHQRRLVILNSLNGGVPTAKTAVRLRVAYQGVPGAYSEFAAKTAWPNCTTFPCRTLVDAIEVLEAGRADRAVLPVESTMEGAVVRNYDLLLQNDLTIVQEINLFVHYCLLAMPGVRKGELKRVISHPMALAHCGRALAQLGVDRQAVDDTAGAVELLLSHRMLDTAAIASSQAARLYGLDVLAHGLQDESWNVTRFLILSKHPGTLQENQFLVKTSMVVAYYSGTLSVLLKVLSAFSSRNVNLTKLELHPSSKDDGPVMILDVKGGGILREFPLVMYVDFEGSVEDQMVKDAIADISESPVFVRILGCYTADPYIYGLQ